MSLNFRMESSHDMRLKDIQPEADSAASRALSIAANKHRKVSGERLRPHTIESVASSSVASVSTSPDSARRKSPTGKEIRQVRILLHRYIPRRHIPSAKRLVSKGSRAICADVWDDAGYSCNGQCTSSHIV